MNILPKKSWHVRTKANIERVRRDEEKAAEEEKEKQRRIALAEQEARTALLRKQAGDRQSLEGATSSKTALEGITSLKKEEDSQLTLSSEGNRHINFFSGIEEAERSGANKDYEAEKKAEKEKQEKAIGLLTYLGQSAVEAQASKPWYFKPPLSSKSDSKKGQDRISDQEFDVKTKSKLDPMNDMMRYLEKKRKASGDKDDLDSYHHRKKHQRKDKDREKDRKSSGSSSGSKSIEQLRADRLRREKEERLKQERLLAKVRGVKLPEDKPEEILDDRSRRYNQQYNPELARKRKKPHDYTDYRD